MKDTLSNKLSTQSLTQGALLASLTAVLLIVGTLLPVIGVFLLMAAAVPISVLVVRQGLSVGIMGSVIVALLVTILFGPLIGLSYSLEYMGMAVVIGWMLLNRKSAVKILCAGIALSMVSTVIIGAISIFVMAIPMEQLTNAQAIADQSLEMYRELGMMDNLLEQGMTESDVRAMAESMTQLMFRLTPTLLLILSMVTAYIHYSITIFILKRIKVKVPKMPKFSKWVLPYHTIWAVIAVWALWLLIDYLPWPWLGILCQNLLLLFATILGIFGLSVLFHWIGFEKQNTPMKTFFILMMLFFFSGVVPMAILLGLLDLLFDFRKLRNKPTTVN